jgi:tetratricopeptide (TPR) repeat protein
MGHIMAGALTSGRLATALRLAFYPALESPGEKRFQAVTREAQNARNAGDLAGAEQLYLRAMAEASSDPSLVQRLRYGLAHIYQEQHRYREAEVIFRDQLAKASESPEPNMQVHAAHMCLARLYNDEGDRAKAEEHYKSALGETEKAGLWPDRQLFSSTALWLAKFYVEQQRYSDAEPLFESVVEICAADGASKSSFPYHLHELAKVYEAQEKYDAAEAAYRRALKACEESEQPADFSIVRALDELARFCQARGRYAEAEELSRRGLALVEEKMNAQIAAYTKPSLRWSRDKNLEARIKHARVPIAEALERLAEICERQEKYLEAEPLRRRSLEIKQDLWGETYGWIWVDSLAAHANALHKIGREQEAAELDRRVEAIRAKHPPGSVRSFIRLESRPMKRTLRGRFTTFMNALLHPSPR